MPTSQPILQHRVIAVVGATGTGKSQLAVSLARRFNGEIINCDALQIYEGLPIATNKISVTERGSIPHHLLDCIRLDAEPWTVIQFRTQAKAIIGEIRSRGKLPILVGGTHYYIQSLLFKDCLLEDEVSQVPVREQEQRWPILTATSMEMLDELRKIDPNMAKSWHPKDRRKIRRSLEIWLTTGRKPSEIYERQNKQNVTHDASDGRQAAFTGGDDRNETLDTVSAQATSLQYDPLIIWTHAPLSFLQERLRRRVGSIIEQGLLTEVDTMRHSLCAQELKGRAVDQTRGIWVAIGYKEFVPYLLALQDKITEPKGLERLRHDAIEKTQIRTRQYAKYQIRWIRTKLIPALSNGGAMDRLFLLDGSDVSKWNTDVEATAHDLTAKFLVGAELPDPYSLFPAAGEMLSPGGRQERHLKHCDVCDKSMITDDAWRDHIGSVKHRKTVKAKSG